MKKGLKLGNVLAFFCMIGVNLFAELLPYNGVTVGEVSSYFATDLTPYKAFFAIWFVIYAALGFFLYYQWKEKSGIIAKKAGIYFVLSCLANGAWLLSFQGFRLYLAMICMLVLWFSLFQLYRRLEIGDTLVQKKEQWMVRFPIRLYFAWVCLAAVVNAAVLVQALHWEEAAFVSVFFTIIGLFAILLAAVLMLSVKNDRIFVLVTIYGYIGIITERVIMGTGIWAAGAALTAVLVLIWQLLNQNRGKER